MRVGNPWRGSSWRPVASTCGRLTASSLMSNGMSAQVRTELDMGAPSHMGALFSPRRPGRCEKRFFLQSRRRPWEIPRVPQNRRVVVWLGASQRTIGFALQIRFIICESRPQVQPGGIPQGIFPSVFRLGIPSPPPSWVLLAVAPEVSVRDASSGS